MILANIRHMINVIFWPPENANIISIVSNTPSTMFIGLVKMNMTIILITKLHVHL